MRQAVHGTCNFVSYLQHSLVHNTFELLHVLLVIVWAPWTAHTGDDGEEQEGGGGSHQHSYHQCQPLHLILDHLILLSAAVLVTV